jgi:hypothetical protein
LTDGYPASSGAALVLAAALLLVLLRALALGALRLLPNASARVRHSRPWVRARLLLVLAALFLAALFACLTMAVVQAGWGARWDAEFNLALAPYRVPWLVHAFSWLTTLGTDAALAGAAVIATGFLRAGQRAGLILPLWMDVVHRGAGNNLD